MNDYKITVIIPIYNGEEHIHSLIKSMFKQDIGFNNIELIFIDNVSTDNSKTILREYSENYENIKLIELERHFPTPGRSRNNGILEASSDYIMFCDGDDLYSPDFCKTMYENIINDDVQLVSCRYTVNILGKEKHLNNSFLEGHDSIIKLKDTNVFPEVIQTQANLTIWNKIYERSFLTENDIRFVEDHWAEDFLFSLECFIKAEGILLLTDYSGYIYNIFDSSQSHKKPERNDFHDDGIVPLIKAEKLLKDNDMEVMPFVSEFLVTWIKIFIESDLDNDDLKEIYEEFRPWFKRYSITTRLVNLPLYVNVPINIAVKIFSLNVHFMLFATKLFNILRGD